MVFTSPVVTLVRHKLFNVFQKFAVFIKILKPEIRNELHIVGAIFAGLSFLFRFWLETSRSMPILEFRSWSWPQQGLNWSKNFMSTCFYGLSAAIQLFNSNFDKFLKVAKSHNILGNSCESKYLFVIDRTTIIGV